MATIKIIASNPNTGGLTLDPPDPVIKVKRSELIVWEPEPGCGVKMITNIERKSTPPSNVTFSEMPHRAGSSDNWKARVSASCPYYARFYYSIFWEPENNPQPGTPIKEYDPVIAVRPSTSLLFRIVFIILSAILSIFTLKLFFDKKKKKKKY